MESHSLRNLNLNHLYYFHVIATSGSLSDGAKKLNVSQPTLSQQVIKLETSLNVTLFLRESRGLRLSEDGQFLLKYTRRMFEQAEQMLSALNYQKYQTILKMYRVGTSKSIPQTVVSQNLQPLLTSNKFGLKIKEDNTDQLFTLLEKNELDFIISEKPEDGPLKNREIQQIEIDTPCLSIIVGPKASDLEFSEKGLRSLNNAPYFKFLSNNPQQKRIDRFFLEEDVTPKVVGESDDIHTIASFTSLNKCFTILPRNSLKTFKDLRSLGKIDIAEQPICVFYLGDRDADEIESVVKLLEKK